MLPIEAHLNEYPLQFPLQRPKAIATSYLMEPVNNVYRNWHTQQTQNEIDAGFRSD